MVGRGGEQLFEGGEHFKYFHYRGARGNTVNLVSTR